MVEVEHIVGQVQLVRVAHTAALEVEHIGRVRLVGEEGRTAERQGYPPQEHSAKEWAWELEVDWQQQRGVVVHPPGGVQLQREVFVERRRGWPGGSGGDYGATLFGSRRRGVWCGCHVLQKNEEAEKKINKAELQHAT